MAKFWVLVANSSSAQVFEVEGLGKIIRKVTAFDFPAGRARERDINTDRHGSNQVHVGSGGHGMETQLDPHRRQQELWATELVEFLQKEHDDQSFEKLTIVAPPQFLGILRHTISHARSLKSAIAEEVDKGLPEYMTEPQMIEHLRKTLNLWNR